MTRANAPLVNLTGGEVSPRLNGRPDVSKQRNGLRTCENFQIVVHGGARKRSGTQFVCELPNNDHVLQPFLYSTSDSYMLVFGPGYIWVAKDRGLVAASTATITGISKASTGVVTTSAAHGLSNGDKVQIAGVGGMTEVNNRIFTVAGVTADTFQLSGVDTSAYTTYGSGGSAAKLIVVTTTYAADELQELRFAQYNDVVYITHKDHPLRKLSRVSNTEWTLETVSLTTGPFRTINGDDSKVMTFSPRGFSITGATRATFITITTSNPHVFERDMVVSFDSVGGMTQLNGNKYTIRSVPTPTTFTLYVNSTAFTAYTGGGFATVARTDFFTFPVGAKLAAFAPWGEFNSGHVGALYRISEAGGGSAVFAPPLGNTESGTLSNGINYTTAGNVYGVSNVSGDSDWSEFNRVPEHESGTVQVRGTRGRTFDASFLHPGYCVIQITEVSSPTLAYVTIVRYQMAQSIRNTGSSFWEEGAWNEYRRYPRCCAMFEQRLWLGGSDSEPNVIWGSRSSAFENFQDGTEDDDAIVYRAASGYADTIRWMSGGRTLTAGTSQGEYAIAASNQNEALTPTNLRMLLQTTYGTSDCPPVRVNEAVLYPQRNGDPSNASRKLREYTYDFTADTFNSVDLTVFAEHITGSGIKRLAYAMQPDPMVWAVREDGQLAVCTYERLQEVIAWQRHRMGGTAALAKSVAVCPGPSGDDVWVEVSRTVNGSTVRYLEVFHPAFEPVIHEKEDGVFVDAALTYSGASTSTITGLWHLRGQAVKVLNNGAVETGTVNSSGTLTLATPTTKAHIGLAYTAVLETQDLEAGAQMGTAQSRMKRISDLFIRVLGSLGGSAGDPRNASNLVPLRYRDADTPMGQSPDLFDGLLRLEAPGQHDREARIRIEHDDPLPFFVTALVMESNTVG